MIPCLAAETCEFSGTDVDDLAAHLATRHLVGSSMARTLAQEAATKNGATTFTVPLDALTTKTTGRIRVRATTPDGPPLRITTLTLGTKEPTMPAKKRIYKKADPAACRLCARMRKREGPRARGRDARW